MTENWPGMISSADLVRIGTHAADEGECPDRMAAKARPALRPAQRSRARKQRLDDFPLGAVMDALDEIEFRGKPAARVIERLGRSGKPLHPGAVRWAQDATASFLSGAARHDTPTTVPVEDYWVVQRTTGQRLWEAYAWGRRYESPDRSVREIRLLRFGDADPARRDPSQVAIAAFAAAFGVPAPWADPWKEAFRPVSVPSADVQRVRVVEVGLADGDHKVLFDGKSARAQQLYARDARDRVAEMITRGVPVPGRSCVDCKLVTACQELKAIPGILSITEPNAPLRAWSVSSGRYYRSCPARDHLTRLHLPKQDEYSASAVRGQAVHAWLKRSHGGQLHSPCTAWDTPHPADDWSEGKWHVTGEEARRGALMLLTHAELCPFHRADSIGEVQVEPALTVHDTAANVIVTASPDVLYQENGAWVWRETKSRTRPLKPGTDILREFPQLALATVLLAENLLLGKPEGMRIELELLMPDAGDVLLIDPNDPAEVARAREVIHALAEPWHADETATSRPGSHCGDCPVRRWCPDAAPATSHGGQPPQEEVE